MQASRISGAKLLQLRQIAARLEHEHAAVPVVIAGGDELHGEIERRLLDELRHRIGGPDTFAAPNVAVAGFGRMRHDSEGDELVVLGQRNGHVGGLREFAHIADHMIRRRDDERGVGIDFERLERRERHGGRGVAARGLEQDG